MVYCLLLGNVWTGPVDIYCNALSRLSTFTVKKNTSGWWSSTKFTGNIRWRLLPRFLSLNAFSAHCCVCEGNILCLLRSCLRLCGVGCFIPWEDNRPASLTGTCDLTRSCHLALTLAAVGDHCMLFLWSHFSQNAIHTRWSIRFIFCIVCDPNISVFEVLFLLELCY